MLLNLLNDDTTSVFIIQTKIQKMKIQNLLAVTLAATMATVGSRCACLLLLQLLLLLIAISSLTICCYTQSLGYASVYAYPKYYTDLNDDEAGESGIHSPQGTIKTMFQEILLRATSSSTNGRTATDGRIFSNLFSFFFVLAGIWGDLLIIRICLTCAYIFMLPFQILINGYKENYAWICACK